MSDNPYTSPPSAGESPPRMAGTLGRKLIGLLAVLGVVGLLIALLLPAQRGAREPALRTECANRLRQIALALLNYESEYHSFPPACTVDSTGKPLHSWRTLILPYLEGEGRELYDKIDLSKPWDDPANKEAFETVVSSYICPSSARFPGRNHTNYLAVVIRGGCLQPGKPRKLSEITDGAKLTLIVVEVDYKQGVHWMSPADAGEQWLLNLDKVLQHSHPGGFQGVCVDASCHFFPSDIKTEVLRALISIDGNDDSLAQEMD